MKLYKNSKAVAHEQARVELAEARLTARMNALDVAKDDVRFAREALRRAKYALALAKKLPAPRLS